MNKYDFFIAARYRNKDNALNLLRKIRNVGYSSYFCAESDASKAHCGSVDCDPEEAMEKLEAIKDWRDNPGIKEVFETDIAALKACNTLILLLPAGKSAHMETGVAYGLGKKLVLIGEQNETESLYLMFDEFYDTIEDFIQNLQEIHS